MVDSTADQFSEFSSMFGIKPHKFQLLTRKLIEKICRLQNFYQKQKQHKSIPLTPKSQNIIFSWFLQIANVREQTKIHGKKNIKRKEKKVMKNYSQETLEE